jgi:hypothetical protein
MNQELSLQDKKRARFEATIDIVYLLTLLSLYVGAVLSPIMGIIYAILLKSGSLTDRGKKIGKTCLIIALISLGVWVLFFIIIIIIAVIASAAWY